MNILAHIDNKIWAILPSELNKMRSAAASDSAKFQEIAATFKPQAFSDSPSALRYGKIVAGGVAVIEIKEVLYNPAGFIDELIGFYFGGTSIPDLMADIEAVTNNPAVQSVVFKIHSPGGDVFGINETSDKIAALTAKKPTVAYCYGYCASAAYFLAAKCGKIVTDAQALIGSIGVVAGWADYTGFYESLGIAYEEVTSTNAPYKRLDIRVPEERAVFMSEIDGIEAVFQKAVSKGRKVSIDTVRNDFGAGAVMAGYLAVKAGLADETGSFSGVLKELGQKNKKKMSAMMSAEGDTMSLMEKFQAWLGSDEVKAELETAPPAPDADRLLLEANAKAEKAEQEKQEILLAQRAATIAGFGEKAQSYAAEQVKSGRLTPAEEKDFSAAYLQALTDDFSSPLAEGSRVARIEGSQNARTPHLFDKEVVGADETAKILKGDDDTDTEVRRAELLNKTPLGKAALKVIEGGQSATAQAK